ncbi:MAG: DUF1343 domain-containing protein [Acidobacteriota bacterium]|nr:DUF1343 domain-containing protein [Acidobacteriota bacterium]
MSGALRARAILLGCAVLGCAVLASCGPAADDPLPPAVLPGLDRLAVEGPGDLLGKRVGLLTNHTGRTIGGQSAAAALLEAGVEVALLFGPEHGVSGSAAAGEEVASGRDPETGLPVVSLYGERRSPDGASLAGLDALVFDIQDIGVRFYTYISTLRNALVAANWAGVEFWVLDRPNPNGGDRVEGPMLDPEFRSFVGTDRLPLLHGMTVGELARLFAAREGSAVRVVPVKGLTRGTRWEETELPWRPPSPNIPTLESALVYPGFGLFEGVMLSEGRGTETPFEVVGAPWVDAAAWISELEGGAALPGVRFTETRFTPRAVPAAPSPRFADEASSGLRVEITDLAAFRPVRTGLRAIEAVRRAHPGDFAWRASGERFWLDLLLGTDRVRRGIDAGVPVDDLMASEAAAVAGFLEERSPHLLYPDR